MLKKIHDLLDTKVDMVVVINSTKRMNIFAHVLEEIDIDRIKYQVYKNDDKYLVELRMPYNRYFKMMKELIKRGYNLRPESKADIINVMIKD